MQFCGCLLFSCLLINMLLHCSVQQEAERVVRPASRAPVALRSGPGGVKAGGEEPTEKLLRLDELRTENEVMEPKRKRSFSGTTGPLDRLSVSNMDPKQGAARQSKPVESPRRRVNPPPVDRIGMSRLPNSRG